jgi:DNA-directed RNA polymerase specialized sigma24 family protein
LALVAAGDSRALGRIYDRHAGDVLALARIVLQDEAEAAEVVIETFVDLWRTASDPDDRDDAFLRTHLLADAFVRARARTRRMVQP